MYQELLALGLNQWGSVGGNPLNFKPYLMLFFFFIFLIPITLVGCSFAFEEINLEILVDSAHTIFTIVHVSVCTLL